ncbi:MAG: DivIVA domain-containing protein [Acidimicrobiales bacterium]
METKTHSPSFTVSLRGYDREEVDEYLDGLAETLNQADDAEDHTRRLQVHVARLNSRIKELEDRLSADTPRSGAALGERIGILLQHAEDAATDTVARAEATAAEIRSTAEARAAEAEDVVRAATLRAEEQARRIESVARGEAAEIVAEADARAVARTRQIEQWAEQVISHTRAEEARMLAEHESARAAAKADLDDLLGRHAAATATLTQLRDAIDSAVGIGGAGERADDCGDERRAGTAGGEVLRAPENPETIEGAEASSPGGATHPGHPSHAGEPPHAGATGAGEAGTETPGGAGMDGDEIEAAGAAQAEDPFEAKLEAWVAGEPDRSDLRG